MYHISLYMDTGGRPSGYAKYFINNRIFTLTTTGINIAYVGIGFTGYSLLKMLAVVPSSMGIVHIYRPSQFVADQAVLNQRPFDLLHNMKANVSSPRIFMIAS